MKKLLLFVLLITIFPVSSVLAVSIAIDPPSVHLVTEADTKTAGVITVSNLGDKAVDVSVYLEDWIFIPDGSKAFKPAGDVTGSCSEWISVYPEKLRLDPKSEKKVTYTLLTPKVAQGGHHGVIFFETVPPRAIKGGSKVAFAAKLGTLVYQETAGNTKRSAEVTLVGKRRQGIKEIYSYNLANHGNCYVKGVGELVLLNTDGTILERGKVNGVEALPGDSRSFQIELKPVITSNEYIAILTLDIGDTLPLVLENKFDVGK